jgi:hypothetical protein
VSKLLLSAILNRLDALETTVLGRPRQRLSKAEVAKSECCSTRTVPRRVEKGALPPPDDVINGRLFWWSDTLERHRCERARAEANTPAARAARNPRLRKSSHTSPEI